MLKYSDNVNKGVQNISDINREESSDGNRDNTNGSKTKFLKWEFSFPKGEWRIDFNNNRVVSMTS